MGRGNETYGKKEVRAKKAKKRKEKEQKRQERKTQSRDGNNLDDMIAYVDEFGNITSTPPDMTQKKAIKAEDIQIGVPRNNESGVDKSLRTGIVSFYNDSKGYGFIRDDLRGDKIFFHIKDVAAPIKENDKVTFEITKGLKGLNAVNIQIVKG